MKDYISERVISLADYIAKKQATVRSTAKNLEYLNLQCIQSAVFV